MSRLLIVATFIAATFGTIPHTATASQGWTECNAQIADKNTLPYEVPNAVRICRDGVIAISYDKDMLNPALSMYYITPAQASNLLPGRDSFFQDPDLKAMGITQATVNSKAFSTEWNRGHLAPSHIMSYSTVSKKACYTMANIAPQAGYFNQHPWESLESKVASWVAKNKALYIITGVAYKNRKSPTRTADNIAVPDYYWKVMCEPTTGNTVGFYGANIQGNNPTTDFVTVSSIEAMYGGRLFPTGKCKTAVVNKAFWW